MVTILVVNYKVGARPKQWASKKIRSGDIPNGSGGTLVEPWWNLTSGPPQTTPEPIWAETPKLAAVGEKEDMPISGHPASRLALRPVELLP